MVEYHGMPEYLKLRIPEFDQPLFLSDSPTLLFSELSYFTLRLIEDGDNHVIGKVVGVLEELSPEQNPSISALIDEFCITMYDNDKSRFASFKTRLSPETQQIFDKNVELWTAQNKK